MSLVKTVHVNVVLSGIILPFPLTGFSNIGWPLHTVLIISKTNGFGCTKTLMLNGKPLHPPKEGVTE